MRKSFRPTLEALEARWVPTVTPSIKNGVAYLLGDSRNDTVNVVASVDANDHDILTVTYTSNKNGSTTTTSFDLTDNPLTGLTMDLGKGNDLFTLTNLAGTGFNLTSSFNLNANLGDGRDRAVINMSTDITGDGTVVNFKLDGSRDNDSITFDFFGAIGAGATANITLDGGRGKDTINVQHVGVVQGNANFLIKGGNDGDTINAQFFAVAPGEEGATGNVNVRVEGGEEHNRVTLLAGQDDGASISSLIAYYGKKQDKVTISNGVLVYGVKSSNISTVVFTPFS